MTRNVLSPQQFQQLLAGDFPAEKPDLLRRAAENGADTEQMQEIERLRGRRYDDLDDVIETYGELLDVPVKHGGQEQ